MAIALVSSTVLPAEKPDKQALITAFQDTISRTPDGSAKLIGPDGTAITLPHELYQVLREAADALARGLAVTIARHDTVLTTQEAADILGVTRPTLVKLLEEGKIPHTRPGRHRRVLLRDVLAYERRSQSQREEALDLMVAESEEAGLYDLTVDPQSMR